MTRSWPARHRQSPPPKFSNDVKNVAGADVGQVSAIARLVVQRRPAGLLEVVPNQQIRIRLGCENHKHSEPKQARQFVHDLHGAPKVSDRGSLFKQFRDEARVAQSRGGFQLGTPRPGVLPADVTKPAEGSQGILPATCHQPQVRNSLPMLLPRVKSSGCQNAAGPCSGRTSPQRRGSARQPTGASSGGVLRRDERALRGAPIDGRVERVPAPSRSPNRGLTGLPPGDRIRPLFKLRRFPFRGARCALAAFCCAQGTLEPQRSGIRSRGSNMHERTQRRGSWLAPRERPGRLRCMRERSQMRVVRMTSWVRSAAEIPVGA